MKFTVARAEFTRGHHVFHARITPTGDERSWPIMVELDGDPTPPESTRFTHTTIVRTQDEDA